jgi:CRISPR-associated protein Cmr3
MFIKITPLDTLFFRDGKPFSMGEETWATSSVLPNPSVVWGALFSMLCSNGLVTPIIDNEKLTIGRLFLCDEEKYSLYLPMPLDVFQEKDNKGNYVYASKEDGLDIISSISTKHLFLPKSENQVEQVSNLFLKIDDFADYYYREDRNLTTVSLEDIQLSNYKVGIGRNNISGVAETGHLYRVEMTEFNNNFSFVVECAFDGNFPKNGILKLGGEGKTASFEMFEDWIAEDISELDEKIEQKFSKNGTSKRFKLYFSSPSFLKNGSLLEIEKFEILTSFLGKPLFIGGFDVKKNEPKPMLNCSY